MIHTRRFLSLFLAACCLGFSCGRPLPAEESAKATDLPLEGVRKLIEAELPTLLELYKELHRHPELSLQEVRTAAKLADELKKCGFSVTSKVGGTGIVGVLKNGAGPTILVRTDMDALPVTEATGLPYASTVRVRDKTGKEVGVMHACGHDIHMASWVGAARVLAALKEHWSGTLVFIGQPAEEIGTGARQMLEAGLYEKFPRS
ncbi:MAG: M20/M25/M40 family metallo-hydrolase, partial [Gemmataceae bacterium]